MPKKVQDRERLTEMLTLVVTPSMRARLQKLADERVNGVYAYPVRWAIDSYLDSEAPMTEEEIKVLTDEYLTNKKDK